MCQMFECGCQQQRSHLLPARRLICLFATMPLCILAVPRALELVQTAEVDCCCRLACSSCPVGCLAIATAGYGIADNRTI